MNNEDFWWLVELAEVGITTGSENDFYTPGGEQLDHERLARLKREHVVENPGPFDRVEERRKRAALIAEIISRNPVKHLISSADLAIDILDRYDAETKRVPFYMTRVLSHMPPDGPIYGFRSDQWHDPIDDDEPDER